MAATTTTIPALDNLEVEMVKVLLRKYVTRTKGISQTEYTALVAAHTVGGTINWQTLLATLLADAPQIIAIVEQFMTIFGKG